MMDRIGNGLSGPQHRVPCCTSKRDAVRVLLLCAAAFLLAGCRSVNGVSERFPSLSAQQDNFANTALCKTPVQIGSMPATSSSSISESRNGKIVASLGTPTTERTDLVLVNHQEDKKDGPSVDTAKGQFRENDYGVIGLTLESALAQGLTANPDLVALRGQVDVNRAMVKVAGTYPWNPFVQAQYFPNGRPFVRSSEPGGPLGLSNYYIWAMQRFELAHQTRFRKEAALATLSQVEWNIHQAELNTIAQTMRLYFAAMYQKEIHDLAAETAALHEKLADVVDRRFKANLAKAADVTTTKVALRQSKRQLELAQATFQASLLALNQQVNLPMDSRAAFPIRLADHRFVSLIGLKAPGTASSDGSKFAQELVEGRPDVMAAQAGIAISDANHRLAKAARIPDVQAGPIYETGSDDTRFLGLRLQMEIPVWNSGAPLMRQREAELRQQALTHDQLKIRAALEAQSSLDRYERALKLLAAAQSDVSSSSKGVSDEVQGIIRQFQAGQADILAVIAVQNNLIQERRALLDLLNELGQSAAGVVQATALPPSHLIANVTPVRTDK